MQFSPRTRMEEADRLIAGVARLMQSTVYLLPLVPVLYLKLWQDPGLRFEVHLFHEAAIALATLEGAALTYVCWLCYQRSGELLVKRMTQGFMAFTVVYSLHGIFTPVADHHLMLFILYGPASRLLMGALLLYSVRARKRAVETLAQRGETAFWWRFLAFLMLFNLLVAALATSATGALPWPRMSLEAGALFCNLLSLALIGATPDRPPLMRYYTLALVWFASACLAFLLAAPWNHLWWLAHGIFAVGFSILGYGVFKAYLTTHALERVFSSEELFDDLSKVNARLVAVFHEYEAISGALQGKLRECEHARQSFASLLTALPDAILVVNKGGQILEANDAAQQLFGHAERSLVGMPVETLMPVDLRESHRQKRQQFEFARGTRVMGAQTGPLRCLHRDGSEFLAKGSVGSVMVDGKQCVLALLRALTREQEEFVRQRAKDRELIERGRLMNALLSVAPAMLFALQRHADGSYACGLHSDACAQGLAVTPDATPLDWIQQWFNRVLPGELPQLISAIEIGALSHQALQLQWTHHVPGQGPRAMQLSSGQPEDLADGSQVWMCRVLPCMKASHGQ